MPNVTRLCPCSHEKDFLQSYEAVQEAFIVFYGFTQKQHANQHSLLP